jgi:hypothetical protein
MPAITGFGPTAYEVLIVVPANLEYLHHVGMVYLAGE